MKYSYWSIDKNSGTLCLHRKGNIVAEVDLDSVCEDWLAINKKFYSKLKE